MTEFHAGISPPHPIRLGPVGLVGWRIAEASSGDTEWHAGISNGARGGFI